MKKLVLSALMLVAFSTVSMAKTKHVKPMKKVFTDCNMVGGAAYLGAIANGMSVQNAKLVGCAAMFTCEDLQP